MTRKCSPHKPIAVLRTTLLGASVVVGLALTLTACNGDGTAKASPTNGHTSAVPGVKAREEASLPSGPSPARSPRRSRAMASRHPPRSTRQRPPRPRPVPLRVPQTVITRCPYPDEIAVYRYTPEGGSLSLIVKYGNWGCAPEDSDGAPFVTVGKETYLPMDQAAYITVTNPIVTSTENQQIGTQDFLDWIEAHPNSGLVFTYHLGDDGAIDRLEEVFTP